MESNRVANVLQRDRWIIGGMLATTTLGAWWYMGYEARAMNLTGVCRCLGMKMGAPDASPWALAELVPLFFMWSEMMIAMMLPSAAPMILLFGAINRRRELDERPCVSAAIFAAGYLASWALFSAPLALLQWALHGVALLSPRMMTGSSLLAGIILISAGFFQFTPWKRACLHRCQNPLGFLMTQWREGRSGAFAMGLIHGIYCVGCCWLLMALLFVTGVMNLWWIAAITAFVLLEKLLRHTRWLTPGTGLLLVGWGIWLLARR